MTAVASTVRLQLVRSSTTEQSVADFVRKAETMISEFASRVELVVAEVETGEVHSLPEFERHWDELQSWLKTRLKQVRAAEGEAERAVAHSWWHAGKGQANLSQESLVDLVLNLDRVCQNIDRMLLNASTSSHASLNALKKSCFVLRDAVLD